MNENPVARAVDAISTWWQRVSPDLSESPDSPEHADVPVLTISIRLGASWADHPTMDRLRVRQLVGDVVAADLVTLGIPAGPEVVVDSGGVAHTIEVSVDGRRCLYPPSFVERTIAASTREGVEDVLGRDGSATSDLAARVVGEIIRLRPSLLLGAASWERYSGLLDRSGATDLTAVRRELVEPVLDDRLSIRTRPAIEAQIDEPWALGRERIVSAVRPTEVGILVSGAYLRELTSDLSAADSDAFVWVRRSLFQRVGVPYPDFRFVIDDSLPPRTFAFRLNHLPTAPFAGLAPGERVVVHTDPWSGSDDPYPPVGGVVVSDDAAEGSLSPVEYVAACLLRELCRLARCFVHAEGVEGRLLDLELLSPTLVAEAAAYDPWSS